MLLAGLVAARLYWEQSADGAIALYLAATKHFGFALHLYHARVCIDQALQSERYVHCSPSQFKAFIEKLSMKVPNKDRVRNNAYLALYHPTEPNATELLRFCQRHHQCPSDVPVQKAFHMSHATRMLRASYILRLQ